MIDWAKITELESGGARAELNALETEARVSNLVLATSCFGK